MARSSLLPAVPLHSPATVPTAEKTAVNTGGRMFRRNVVVRQVGKARPDLSVSVAVARTRKPRHCLSVCLYPSFPAALAAGNRSPAAGRQASSKLHPGPPPLPASSVPEKAPAFLVAARSKALHCSAPIICA